MGSYSKFTQSNPLKVLKIKRDYQKFCQQAKDARKGQISKAVIDEPATVGYLNWFVLTYSD